MQSRIMTTSCDLGFLAVTKSHIDWGIDFTTSGREKHHEPIDAAENLNVPMFGKLKVKILWLDYSDWQGWTAGSWGYILSLLITQPVRTMDVRNCFSDVGFGVVHAFV